MFSTWTKRTPCIFLILAFFPVMVFSQAVYTLGDEPSAQIKDYAVLQDHGYGLDRILTDTTLPFVLRDSLQPRGNTRYWIRVIIANPFPEARACYIQMSPGLDNTLYYYDANARRWVSHQAGVMTGADNNGHFRRGVLPCILSGQTTLYVLSDISSPGTFDRPFVPQITIEKEAFGDRKEQTVMITWILSASILLLFLLVNGYIYFVLKDRAVLYYLIAQSGGMIFITAYKQAFPVLFPCRVFSIGLFNGSLAWFDLNNLLMHLGILVIIYGLIQFARVYLNTRQYFPRLDTLLRIGLIVYLPLSLALVLVNTRIYIETYALLADNIFTLGLISAIMYASIAGHIRKLPGAKTFLLANIWSLGFMMATSLYHLIFVINNNSLVKTLLPDLAIISQALGFSVALVTRTRLIQNKLALIEQENQKINAEIQQQKNRNDLLQEKLDTNQRELAASAMYVVQKNELLATLQAQIKDVRGLSPDRNRPELRELQSTLQSQLYLDADWEKFKLHFEKVHPRFFEDLQSSYPGLTKNELRLLAYFHIHLSTKEIAALLNIEPASVRRAKTRLYKKIGAGNPDK